MPTPYRYSTTRAIINKFLLKKTRPVAGLGMFQPDAYNSGSLGASQISMSNNMMLGAAIGAVAFVLAKKKGLLT